MRPNLPGHAPILAYFGGYAPAERRTYELAILADGGGARLVSIHTGTLPGIPPHQAAMDAALGRSVRADALHTQPYNDHIDLATGPLAQLLDALLAAASDAVTRGLPLRKDGQIVGAVRLYGFTLPELPGGAYQAPRLPDQLRTGSAVAHPQLWMPGASLVCLPRRHQRRAAPENHPLWNA